MPIVSFQTCCYCCYFESDKTSLEDLKAMLPPDLFDYCKEHQLLDHMIQTCEPSSDNNESHNSDVHSFPPSNTTISSSPPPLLNDDDDNDYYYDLPYLSAAAAAATQYENPTTHCHDPMAISSNSMILDPTVIHTLPPIYPTSSEQV